MAVRWHSCSEHFTAKKKNKTFQLILPAERKKKLKIADEENGLQPERVHARHLDLRLRP